jgi:hypothetical protein
MILRHLIIIALLSLCSIVVKAQLNQSRGQVMQLMANDDDWTFDRSGRTTDGTEYFSYSIPTKVSNGAIFKSDKVFYFFNDTCRLVRLIKTNNQLNDVIKDLNKRFVPMDDNIWHDVKEKAKYQIILVENKPVFTVEETPWKD